MRYQRFYGPQLTATRFFLACCHLLANLSALIFAYVVYKAETEGLEAEAAEGVTSTSQDIFYPMQVGLFSVYAAVAPLWMIWYVRSLVESEDLV